MAIRIAINGFGRIGRTIARHAFTNSEVDLVAVNDRMDPKLMALLLKRDSVHGRRRQRWYLGFGDRLLYDARW